MSVYISEDVSVVTDARQVREDHATFTTRLQAVMVALGFGEHDTVIQTALGASVKIAGVRIHPEMGWPDGWKLREESEDVVVPDHSSQQGMVAGQMLAGLGDVPNLRQILDGYGMPSLLPSVQMNGEYRQVTPGVDLYEDRMVVVKWKGLHGLEQYGETAGPVWERVS